MSNTINTNTTQAKASTSIDTTSQTNRGTEIVRNTSSTLGKDAFYKILAAQLSNLDPSQDQDSTAYIAQMAQFSALEAMQNLNSTMTYNAAQDLNGKLVTLNVVDTNGSYVSGIVRSVYTKSGEIYVTVEDFNGNFGEYKYSTVTDVIDYSDPNMDNLTFSNATNLVGKKAEVSDTVKGEDGKDKNVTVSGTVSKVYRDSEGIKIKLEVEKDGKIETKDYLFNSVLSVES